MSIATASDLEMAPARPLLMPLVSAAACAALADWLFYGWQIGISLALFLGVLGAVAVAGNRVHATRHVQIVMAAIFVAGLLGLIEDVNVLSVILGTLATALFVIVMTARETSSWQRYLFEAAIAPLRGPFQLASDLFGALQQIKQQVPEWLRMGSLIAWIVPLCVFAVFLGLFSSANPLIEHQLMQIDLGILFSHADPQRTVFWILILSAIWPLIHHRIRRKPVRESAPSTAVAIEPSELDYLFGVQAMSRSLILFNALFALQSGLDLVYLWGGVALPDGLTYAEYAHRGAYPDRNAPGRARRAVEVDPSTGPGVDRPEHPSRHLVDPSARSVCGRLLADLFAARGVHLDDAGSRGTAADADPDPIEEAQFLAGRRQRRNAACGIRHERQRRRLSGGGRAGGGGDCRRPLAGWRDHGRELSRGRSALRATGPGCDGCRSEDRTEPRREVKARRRDAMVTPLPAAGGALLLYRRAEPRHGRHLWNPV